MGTRSITIVRDGREKKSPRIITMYRQMDGYPDGHGKDLAEFLSEFAIVNGISMAETRKVANGINCLAALLVAHFKKGPGGFYLHAGSDNDSAGEYGEEYIYEIRGGEEGKELELTCYDVYDAKEIFSGTPMEFLESLKKEAE